MPMHCKTMLGVALMAASILAAAPASAQTADTANGGDPIQNNVDARFHNNVHGYTATTTVHSTPAYVPAPAPSTTYTTVSPNGTTTTTTYTSPGIAYVPVPAYATTTVIAPRPCNPYDVPRPGVTTACPY